MRSRGIEDDRSNIPFGGTSKLTSFSPIVQEVIGLGSMPFYDLFEVFLAVYFTGVEDSPSLDWSHRIEGIQNSIKQSMKDQEGKII